MSREAAIEILQRDVLRNIVPLKMLAHYAQDVRVTVHRNSVMIALPTRASAWDRQAYPESDWIILPVIDEDDDWSALRDAVPRGTRAIFKLNRLAGATLLADATKSMRITSFQSFTGADTFADDRVLCLRDLPASAIPLLEAQGYTPAEVRGYLEHQNGRVYLTQHEGRVAAACISYQNFEHVYEIGGLFTQPAFRKLGLATRLVRAAIAEICRRGMTPRYQFREDNDASHALARAAGLEHFLTMTHYQAEWPA